MLSEELKSLRFVLSLLQILGIIALFYFEKSTDAFYLIGLFIVVFIALSIVIGFAKIQEEILRTLKNIQRFVDPTLKR